MPTTKRPTRKKPPGKDRPEDKFSVEIRLPDRQRLKELLQLERLDVGHIHRDEKEGVEVTLFATKKQIADLKKAGWKPTVGDNLSAVGRERQKEVGKGDRYQGGKKTPQGLGTKTRGEG